MVNRILVQASIDTVVVNGANKCSEIIFIKGNIIKTEELQIMQERMKALDPNGNEIYKFLRCEQAERIDMKKVMEKIQIPIEQRTRKLVEEGLYDKNLLKAMSCRVIPVAACMTNIHNFTGKELDQLDKGIKQILRESYMHGKQCCHERLYLRRELGGRGTKSLKDVCEKTKVRTACYVTFSSCVWINEA